MIGLVALVFAAATVVTGIAVAARRKSGVWEVAREMAGRSISAGTYREVVSRPPELSPEVVVPPRPDGGTRFGIELESLPADVVEVISRARTEIATAGLESPPLALRIRDQGVELRATGEVRLLIHPQWVLEGNGYRVISRESPARVELVVSSRALDTLPGIEGWAEKWLRWASGWLGRPLPDDVDALEGARSVGWRVIGLDLAAELVDLDLRLADAAPERWTGKPTLRPVMLDGDRLRQLDLGLKSNPVSLSCYRKDLRLNELARGAGLRKRWLANGWDGLAPIMRVELRFNGAGLQLRPRKGSAGEPLDLSDPTVLVDPVRLARAWAYGVGRAADRSGLYRLTVPTHAATRRCDVDPRWRAVQEAPAIRVPSETLAQVEVRRTAERADYERRADVRLRGALAARVATTSDPIEGAAQALAHAQRLVQTHDWSSAHQLARADVQDLIP